MRFTGTNAFFIFTGNTPFRFVCIVMDYYKMGDLDRVLKQRRKHKQPLEEIIIKKW